MNSEISTKTQKRKDQQNDSGRRCRIRDKELTRDIVKQYNENDKRMKKLEEDVESLSREIQRKLW